MKKRITIISIILSGFLAFAEAKTSLALLAVNAVSNFYPSLPLSALVTQELRDYLSTDEPDKTVLEKDELTKYFEYWCLNPEISEYSKDADILAKLKECNTSEDTYFLFALPGNNPDYAEQWFGINGFDGTEITGETLLMVTVTDITCKDNKYKIKDISRLIAIKVQL